jgi:alpha-beta hydrolase superfamily lysophospholipase
MGSGDVRLYASTRRPQGEARCVLFFVLGPEVTSEPPYPRLSAAAQERGHALVTLHARGTGYSDGLRGDIKDYGEFLRDLKLGLERAHAQFVGRPVFLFGHSVGATLALELAATATERLGGVVLVNPAYRLRYSEGMSPSCRDYAAFAFNAVFRRAALTVDMNRNPGAVKFGPDRDEGVAMQRDPLAVRYFSLRMLSAQRRVMRRAPHNASAVDVPVLLVQGAHDALVDPRGNDEILAASRSSDTQKRIAPLGGHGSSAVETMVEPILEWIEARCRQGDA